MEEEKCDGERELAQVSSSVGVVVMYSGHRFGTLGLRGHLSGPSLKLMSSGEMGLDFEQTPAESQRGLSWAEQRGRGFT